MVVAACPDGGACHHECVSGAACWRVGHAAPLSGAFPGDEWPVDAVDEMAVTLHATTDAEVWAKAFAMTLDQVPEMDPRDVGLMTGWFANAIETGRAHGTRLRREDIIRHLEDAHCIIWGQVHDASNVKGREKAADWLLELVERIVHG